MGDKYSFFAEAAPIASKLAIQFEGVYLSPYLCPAKKATIGVGATFYEDGTVVSLADPRITKERAYKLLDYHLTKFFMPKVFELCDCKTPEQLAALTDFAFNAGISRLAASTLRKRINSGDYAGSQDELMRWTRGGGKVLQGLVKRRAAECLLLL